MKDILTKIENTRTNIEKFTQTNFLESRIELLLKYFILKETIKDHKDDEAIQLKWSFCCKALKSAFLFGTRYTG